MLQPAGGLRKVSRGGEPEGRAILESPLRKGTRRWRPSITRGGCVAAPHLNLLPLGEEARPPGPAHASARGRVAQGLQRGAEGRAIRESPLREGTRRWRPSITRSGCVAAPHLNLLSWGEEARPPGPTHASARGRVAQGLQRGAVCGGSPCGGGLGIAPPPPFVSLPQRGEPTGRDGFPLSRE